MTHGGRGPLGGGGGGNKGTSVGNNGKATALVPWSTPNNGSNSGGVFGGPRRASGSNGTVIKKSPSMPFFNSLIREFFDLDASIRSMPPSTAVATHHHHQATSANGAEMSNVVRAYQTNTSFSGGGGVSTVALSRTQTFKCRSVGNVGALVNAAGRASAGGQPRMITNQSNDTRFKKVQLAVLHGSCFACDF